jgi:hypothetical protein
MAAVTTLPSAFVANTILTAAELNNLRGAFRVLQVVGATTSTSTSTTSATFATTTLTATITPSFSSSKILVLSSSFLFITTAATEGATELVRGATQIGVHFPLRSSADNLGITDTFMILDNPATTSATTYTVNARRASGSGSVTSQSNSSTSGIILMEISA